MPTAKSSQSEKLTELLSDLVDHASSHEKAAQGLDRSKFFAPEGVTDLLAIETLGVAFDRTELYSQFQQIVASGEDPGTTGDLVSVLVQGDFLAAAERAYRHRHSTSVRDKLLASGRCRGHADKNGILRKALPGYLQQIQQLASG